MNKSKRTADISELTTFPAVMREGIGLSLLQHPYWQDR